MPQLVPGDQAPRFSLPDQDGKPVSTKVGAAPKSALKQWVDSAI